MRRWRIWRHSPLCAKRFMGHMMLWIFFTRLPRTSQFNTPLRRYGTVGVSTNCPHSVHADALHRRQESISTVVQPSPATIQTKTPTDSLLNAHVQPSRVQSKSAEPIDPRLMAGAQGYDKEKLDKMLDLHLEPGYEDALKAWSRFRFVRAGWFTSQEAIKYIA